MTCLETGSSQRSSSPKWGHKDNSNPIWLVAQKDNFGPGVTQRGRECETWEMMAISMIRRGAWERHFPQEEICCLSGTLEWRQNKSLLLWRASLWYFKHSTHPSFVWIHLCGSYGMLHLRIRRNKTHVLPFGRMEKYWSWALTRVTVFEKNSIISVNLGRVGIYVGVIVRTSFPVFNYSLLGERGFPSVTCVDGRGQMQKLGLSFLPCGSKSLDSGH